MVLRLQQIPRSVFANPAYAYAYAWHLLCTEAGVHIKWKSTYH